MHTRPPWCGSRIGWWAALLHMASTQQPEDKQLLEFSYYIVAYR